MFQVKKKIRIGSVKSRIFRRLVCESTFYFLIGNTKIYQLSSEKQWITQSIKWFCSNTFKSKDQKHFLKRARQNIYSICCICSTLLLWKVALNKMKRNERSSCVPTKHFLRKWSEDWMCPMGHSLPTPWKKGISSSHFFSPGKSEYWDPLLIVSW